MMARLSVGFLGEIWVSNGTYEYFYWSGKGKSGIVA
jgi:hypothetical protein